MTRIVKYVLFLVFLPFWWLQRLIPRSKNIWVFGAWYGKRYSDNSRSFFLYVIANHPRVKAIWLTRDNEIVAKIRKEGYKAYHVNSFMGVLYSLRAKYVFISSGKKDINPLCINGAKWIQLWHGSPAKKIGLDDVFANSNSFFQQKIVKNFFPWASEFNYHRIASNAPFFSKILASAFGVPIDRIMETGTPRNDIFFLNHEDAYNKQLRAQFPGCKLVYYLPTFRDNGSAKSMFSLPEYNKQELEKFLRLQNIVLVNKGHYVANAILANTKTDKVSRIINLLDEEVSDINYLLKDADALITDYSSAYYDFLLVERSIIFAAFDLDAYLQGSRELYYEYTEAIAGPLVQNWKHLYMALENLNGTNEYETLLNEKNKFFNKYHDNQNCLRVYETINKL